ncbi:hypothetical protein JAAARDRAFT_56612 [Jaapia argillacea MUCL 33604]|uniref:Uncharacterized protein n=1 Tax=Jaapia argillacea MUCL 33604 TaxID=933084 RepID=A0A067PXP9_9AGAM|nr:hypothetical protein JAAARDRAFT_56612 [Jaapia argillacea MUCL 33604]
MIQTQLHSHYRSSILPGILLNPSPRNSITPLPRQRDPSPSPISDTPGYNSLSSASSSNDEDLSSSTDLSQLHSTPMSTVGSRKARSVDGSSRPGSARKIRFAPLPDPRRDVLVTDEGEELPLSDTESRHSYDPYPSSTPASIPEGVAVNAITPPSASLSTPNSCSLHRSPSGSPRQPFAEWEVVEAPRAQSDSSCTATEEYIATPATHPLSTCSSLTEGSPLTPTQSTTSNGTYRKKDSSSGGFTRRLLKPFLGPSKKSGVNLSISNLSTEDVLTLGTINLFRSSSRDSRGGESEKDSALWGTPLDRTTSAGSTVTPHSKPSKSRGFPLGRSQSMTAADLSTTKKPTTTPSTSKPTPARQSRKGTRMLNGRVYGAKRQNSNANPFANARDDEPEFVEWGYGGMGSVKTGVGNAVWRGVQGGKTSVMGGGGGGGVTGSGTEVAADDEDDGTGMGWVKRRREQRERERKEREEAEKKAKEAAETPTIEVHAPDAEAKNDVAAPAARPSIEDDEGTVVEAETTVSSKHKEEAPISIIAESQNESAPAPVHEVSATTKTTGTEPEHVYTAVTVPAPVSHKAIHHPHSDGGPHTSDPAHTASVESSDVTQVVAQPSIDVATEEEDDDEAEADVSAGDDEDSEDEADIEARKTSRGAGVEKISRHKEKE